MKRQFIPDYHIHTEFSSDCKTPVCDLILSAKKMGFSSICITDHNDLNYPDTPDHISFNINIDKYINTLTKIKNENCDFDLRIGLEQGVMPSTCSILSDYSKMHPGLDFIICSSHIVDGFDPYYSEYFQGRDYKECCKNYFENILYNVCNFHDYNVYGHLDYIFRYGSGIKLSKDFNISDYKDILECILKTIISDGKGIEINTGSLYRGLDFAHPHKDILKLYHDLGGEIITFGSDSHDKIHIGYDFKKAADIAASIGFKYYCTFKNMHYEYNLL